MILSYGTSNLFSCAVCVQVEKAGMTVGIRPLPDKGYDMDELEVCRKNVDKMYPALCSSSNLSCISAYMPAVHQLPGLWQ